MVDEQDVSAGADEVINQAQSEQDAADESQGQTTRTSGGYGLSVTGRDPEQLQRARAASERLRTAGAGAQAREHAAGQAEIDAAQQGIERQRGDQAEIERINREQVEPIVGEANARSKDYDAAVQARTEWRTKMQDQIDFMDQAAKQIASEPVHDFWADRGTFSKATYLVGAMLGGAAQAFYGDRTNPVVEQVNSAIQRDLMMQRLRLEKNKDDYANRNLLVKQFMDFGLHAQDAQDKAYLTAVQGIVGRLNAAKQLLQTPEQRMKVDQAVTNWQMKMAEVQQRVAQNDVGNEVRRASAEATIESNLYRAGTGTTSVQQERADTAATNARIAQAREDRMRRREKQGQEFVDWEPADERGYLGTDKEHADFRKAEAAATTVTDRMEMLKNDLAKGRIKNLFNWGNWSKLQQDISNLVEAAKQPGLVNTGANFQGIEQTLIEKGYMATNGDLIDPVNAAKLISSKEAATWKEVKNKAHQYNAKPRKSHPIFGGGE